MKKWNVAFICILLSQLSFGQLTGTIPVPSTNYPTIQAVVDSLNQYGVGSGGVVFEVIGDQVFNTPLLNLTATGSQNSTITIKWDGTGTKPVLNFTGTAATSEAGFSISGSDYFRLEGFQILAANNLLEYGILLSNANTDNACQNNIFSDLYIGLDKTNTNQTEGIRVVSSAAPVSVNGTHANNKFWNNTIENSIFGYNFDSGTGDVGLMGFGNEVGTVNNGTSLITDISLCGIYIKGQNGFKAFNTQITNLERIGTGVTAPAGIATASSNPTANLTGEFEFYGNVLQNHHSGITSIFGFYLNARKSVHRVYNNKIINITATGGGTNTATGIMVFGTSIVAKIYNNMISGIAAPATAVSALPATRGIELRTFSECHVYFNTVKLEYTASNPANSSGALTIINDTDPVYLKNNIFINNSVLAGGSTGVAAALYKSSNVISNIQNSSSNNLYYAGEPSVSHPIYFAYNATTPDIGTNLTEYQALAVNFDQTAFTGNVNFVAETDLHVNISDTFIREKALPVMDPFAVETDFDLLARDPQNPDLGADELLELNPLAAFNPFPLDGSMHVSVFLDSVQWDYINDNLHVVPAGFKVYKNTSPDFSETIHAWVPYVAGQSHYSIASMAQVELEYNTRYYWKVVPTANEELGPDATDIVVWSFFTEPFVYPYPAITVNDFPANNQIGLSVLTDSLAWQYLHDTNYTLPYAFKVYFGTNPDLALNEVLGTVNYNPGQESYFFIADTDSLEYETVYYWKIESVADSLNGAINPTCQTWSFTTEIDNAIQETSLVKQISFYPNPAKEKIHFSNAQNCIVSIFSCDGSLVASKEITNPNYILSLNEIASGMYFLRIASKKGNLNYKLIIR